MRFFKKWWKKWKKKKKRRQSTTDEKLQRLELNRKRWQDKQLVEMAEKDPALKRQIIAHAFGFPMPDPAEGQLLELKALIINAAIQEIKDNKDMAKDIAQAKIFQTMQSEGLAPSNEEIRNRPSQLEQTINWVESIARLKAAMGIKEPGVIEKYLPPEVVATLVSILPSIIPVIFGGKTPQNATEKMVSVEIDGIPTLISWSEYEKLQKERTEKKTRDVNTPKDEMQKKDTDMTGKDNLDTPDGKGESPVAPDS